MSGVKFGIRADEEHKDVEAFMYRRRRHGIEPSGLRPGEKPSEFAARIADEHVDEVFAQLRAAT